MTRRSTDLPSGVYLAPADLQPLREAAKQADLAWFDINLAGVAGKRDFLSACAKSLRLPRSFGGNWDALADCLKDLLADSVLNLRNSEELAGAAPDHYATALEILHDAAGYWEERGSRFVVLTDAGPEGVELPSLPGH